MGGLSFGKPGLSFERYEQLDFGPNLANLITSFKNMMTSSKQIS